MIFKIILLSALIIFIVLSFILLIIIKTKSNKLKRISIHADVAKLVANLELEFQDNK
jgi:hypothetical protein